MKNIKFIFFILFGCISFSHAKANNTENDINAVISKSGLNKNELAVFISDGLSDNSPVYSLNSDKKMLPASLTKLVTAAAVLKNFSPGTKFLTELYSSGSVSEGKLKGNIYLKGGGDPSFVSENMWVLVNNFLRTGIREIEGDIIVDDSLFDKIRYDSSRESARVDRAYDAPTGAMSFNWNSINIFVRPSDKEGEPAKVFLDPENDYTVLKSSIKTSSANSGRNISVDRQELNEKSDRIVVTGSIAKGMEESVIYNNITKPDIWAGSNLKSFLRQRGVSVSGTVRNGETPQGAKLVSKSESKPVEQILADMNKFSNNFVAEMLTKNLGAKHSKPGSIAKGMEVIKRYMTDLGVSASDFELVNPSGLTRENRITSKALWAVLHDMRDQFQYQPEFASSLPIAGVDGTLKRRMKDSKAERWVRAKTGLLSEGGVVALAGYAGRKDGTIFPFVMIYNGKADGSSVRNLFDNICITLVK